MAYLLKWRCLQRNFIQCRNDLLSFTTISSSIDGSIEDVSIKSTPGNVRSKWTPEKRLFRHEIDHLRELKKSKPEEWTNLKLAKRFGISYSAVRRILRSKFEPSDEIQKRQDAATKRSREIRKERPTRVSMDTDDQFQS